MPGAYQSQSHTRPAPPCDTVNRQTSIPQSAAIGTFFGASTLPLLPPYRWSSFRCPAADCRPRPISQSESRPWKLHREKAYALCRWSWVRPVISWQWALFLWLECKHSWSRQACSCQGCSQVRWNGKDDCLRGMAVSCGGCPDWKNRCTLALKCR